jgi:hypothetical protein
VWRYSNFFNTNFKTRQKEWNEWKKLHILSEDSKDLKMLKEKIETKHEEAFPTNHIEKINKLKIEKKYENSDYFFYCSQDQLIFLIPLNIKMLLFEFENFDKLPELITGKILETEKETMTDEIRKYFKYLSYIPLGADIFFIEIDLSNIVSKKTLKHFGKDLAIRKSKRNKKLEMEKIANEEFEKKQKEMNEKRLYDTVKFQVILLF